MQQQQAQPQKNKSKNIPISGVTQKTKELLELDRLLQKYTDQLAEDQTPLAQNIRRKLKRIQKTQKSTLKMKNQKNIKNTQKNRQFNLKIMCYICHVDLTHRHHFYPAMCQYCGNLNESKRNMKANMVGKVALVTGGRVKIGYYTVLSLLRNGAHVISTTRFAYDAVSRYMKENDYQTWKQRLSIIQVSMNSLQSITRLTTYIINKFKKLDILINNAAQTLRRPRAFYSPLETISKEDPDKLICLIIDDYFQFNNDKVDLAIEGKDIIKFAQQHKLEVSTCQNQRSHELPIPQGPSGVLQLPHTQVYQFTTQILTQYNKNFFPSNIYDQHSQQIDLRPINSWIRTIEDTNILQLGQVLMINCVAPFTLIQQLVSIMKKQAQQTWIINVSSMQGCFSRRNKTKFHPHTNMAKSALNMITRTCGQDFYRDNIIMLSVDTGWNTIEQPNSYHQKSPLDCIDGAVRILDPIYNKLKKPGIFYKDFLSYDW